MFDELVDQAIEDATTDPDGLHLFRVKFNDAGEMYGLTQVIDMDDADFAAADMGWHRYEQPDCDPRHLCPKCAEKEAMK